LSSTIFKESIGINRSTFGFNTLIKSSFFSWPTLEVRYGDVALPIAFETVKKDVVYSDLDTGKQKLKSQISKNDMFRFLIQQAVKNHVLFDYVLADNWFGSKQI